MCVATQSLLEAHWQKQGMWVGLTREGFLEERSQEPGDGDRPGGCASGPGGSLYRHVHLCSCISAGSPFNERSR